MADPLWEVSWRTAAVDPVTGRPILLQRRRTARGRAGVRLVAAECPDAWNGELRIVRLDGTGKPSAAAAPIWTDVARALRWHDGVAPEADVRSLWGEEVRVAVARGEMLAAVEVAVDRGVRARVMRLRDGLAVIDYAHALSLRATDARALGARP